MTSIYLYSYYYWKSDSKPLRNPSLLIGKENKLERVEIILEYTHQAMCHTKASY